MQFIVCAQNIIVLHILTSCNYLVRPKDERTLEVHSCCAHLMARLQYYCATYESLVELSTSERWLETGENKHLDVTHIDFKFGE